MNFSSTDGIKLKMGCILSNELSSYTLNNTEPLTLKGCKQNMKVVQVYDGDTVTVIFKLGKKFYHHQMRLAGIDSAELHPNKMIDGKIYSERELEMRHANIAKSRLEKLCLNKIVFVHCDGWDKYGRLLGTIYLKETDSMSVNRLLVQEGLAYEYDGKSKKNFLDWYTD